MAVPIIPENPFNYGQYRSLFWLDNVLAGPAASGIDQPMYRLGSFQSFAYLTAFCWIPSVDLTGVVMSVWTGPGATGTQLIVGASLSTCTVAAGRQQLTISTVPITLTLPTEPAAYIRITTTYGSAATIGHVQLIGVAFA